MTPIRTNYRGYNFRSRTEARWAAFFDELGWEWEYEPLDCDGYIPDFVLLGERPVLVEVKSEFTMAALKKEADRCLAAIKPHWTNNFLIVGGTPELDHIGYACVGVLYQLSPDVPPPARSSSPTSGPPDWTDLLKDVNWEETLNREPVKPQDMVWDGSPAPWLRCVECGRITFCHLYGAWDRGVCGHLTGLQGRRCRSLDPHDISSRWARACNATAWMANA